jgi:hypothetical protein
LHRDGGPAIIFSNGDKQWFCKGRLHRTDGPAAEYANGHKEWWLGGRQVYEKEVEELRARNLEVEAEMASLGKVTF